jgi:hypothetical protein
VHPWIADRMGLLTAPLAWPAESQIADRWREYFAIFFAPGLAHMPDKR